MDTINKKDGETLKIDKLYLKARDFLENFSLDFNKLPKKLEEIMTINFSLLDIDKNVTISFDESKLFGKSASVSKTNISFNKTRIEMLTALKIDDTDKNHLKRMEDFYAKYDERQKHSTFEENLYNFMKKYKSLGAEWALACVGSYKTLKYEILGTLFHEIEHIYQDEFKNCLHSDHYPNDVKSIVLIFTTLFNVMFENLQKKGVSFDYKRENHIFPIEFDARYEALKNLNEIKKLYFSNNQDFANFLVKSNIIPKEFDAEKTSKQIFDDYEKIYHLHTQNFGDEFSDVNKYICSNKDLIVKEFVRRYNEMKKISAQTTPNCHYSYPALTKF